MRLQDKICIGAGQGTGLVLLHLYFDLAQEQFNLCCIVEVIPQGNRETLLKTLPISIMYECTACLGWQYKNYSDSDRYR